ncbi:TPA: AAA family ATPase [Legionella pneumophila]|uniref:AAA family ATPase n=1 Tax=Legionella pneumophila TaxID=446 RepID=UPI00077773F7|nr:AAA family ATPase [Legionella pneumophila]HAT8649777.1 AAA family ATPase [Legionella pneumophila]HAU0839710.1 AAA family ATPase [Legionella pneumophila]HAU0883536.1 AAA family ATPase [Legionella pneumophila]
MLIIFGGLPGTGKTTISKQIAKQLNAVYLRIDTVEQAFKKLSGFAEHWVGPEGYMICYAIALDNLKLGLPVVADSVNPIAITRNDWQKVAMDANAPFIEIELVCSNAKEHQRRIETRKADIPGHNLPNWIDVLNRDYEPWQSKSIALDTSEYSVEESVEIIMDFIRSKNLIESSQ